MGLYDECLILVLLRSLKNSGKFGRQLNIVYIVMIAGNSEGSTPAQSTSKQGKLTVLPGILIVYC